MRFFHRVQINMIFLFYDAPLWCVKKLLFFIKLIVCSNLKSTRVTECTLHNSLICYKSFKLLTQIDPGKSALMSCRGRFLTGLGGRSIQKPVASWFLCSTLTMTAELASMNFRLFGMWVDLFLTILICFLVCEWLESNFPYFRSW